MSRSGFLLSRWRKELRDCGKNVGQLGHYCKSGTASGPGCISKVCLHEVVPKSLFVRAKSLRDRTEVKAILTIRKTGVVFALYLVKNKHAEFASVEDAGQLKIETVRSTPVGVRGGTNNE